MNVLSLFDGISSGRIALDRAGIKVDNYFASEIDKNAIKVAQHNYPNTIQIGSVLDVKAENLPKIDLLTGGFNCQSFSLAGKQANFNDPRGKLFFECVRLLKECNPKYFLFENVKMKKEYQDVISGQLGVEPIKINSSLVSAQNRNRLYWTNIPNIPPQDKGITLQDIIDKNPDNDLVLKGKGLNKVFKPRSRVSNIVTDKKCGCLLTKNKATDAIVFFDNIDTYRYPSRNEAERLQTVPESYTSPISYNQAMYALGNGWTVDVIAHIFKGIQP